VAPIRARANRVRPIAHNGDVSVVILFTVGLEFVALGLTLLATPEVDSWLLAEVGRHLGERTERVVAPTLRSLVATVVSSVHPFVLLMALGGLAFVIGLCSIGAHGFAGREAR